MTHIKPSFSTYMGNVAPLTPLDNTKLVGAKQPRLIFDEKLHEVKCDLTGMAPKNRTLEKIFSKILKRLDHYDPKQISHVDKAHLETLYSIVNTQTKDYKEKYKGCWGAIVLGWRSIFYGGHVDDLSDQLLLKIQALQTIDPPIKDEKDAIKLVDLKRKEFQETEDKFCLSMGAATHNLNLLQKLRNDNQIQCSHPLFRATEGRTLDNCSKIFADLYAHAQKIQEFIKDALDISDNKAKNKALADIFSTDSYHNYVNSNAEAAEYYPELMEMIKALTDENIFTKESLNDLNRYGQSERSAGFEATPNQELYDTVSKCYAPAAQHVMRFAMLIEDLEKLIPYDAPEYESVLSGVLEAKRNAGSMNFSL